MCQSMTVKNGDLRFPIHIKVNNIWSEPHKEYLYQVWSRSLQPVLRSHLKEKGDGWMDGRRAMA